MRDLGAESVEVVTAFNDALNRHDVPGMMALMTEDVVFENTFPAPDGTIHSGAAAVRRFWEEFLHATPHAHFVVEELFSANDRCVQRWRFDWDTDGGHVRGVDVIRVRDGKIAEKFSYVKG